MTEPAKIQILIADDHPVFRFGLRAILAAESDVVLVGESSSGEQAIALANQFEPDVILMDINMPGTNGIDATREIRAILPGTAVLVLTMFEDDELVLSAMEAGARGYILKGAGGEEIMRAVRAVAAGEAIFGPAVAARLLSRIGGIARHPGTNSRTDSFLDLTSRELDVLKLLASGMTNSAIAEQLFLSQKTVRNHVSSIFGKMQVNDRGQAIVRAREAGLG